MGISADVCSKPGATSRFWCDPAEPRSWPRTALRSKARTGISTNPRRGPSRRLLARMVEHYRDRFADGDRRIRATFEIAYLTGFAPHPDQQQPLRPGSARMRLADALRRPT